MTAPIDTLRAGAAAMGVALSDSQAERLLAYGTLMLKWNKVYNLTALRDPASVLTHHLLDSLAIHPDLHGATVADVGTGAGFPGLPLAVLNPERRFTLIDSNGKKIRFVQHAARTLGLSNVEGLHGRAETITGRVFDTVVARAFAPLPELVASIDGLSGPHTRVLAMKGKWPQDEINGLPPQWQQQGSRELTIPGLQESRCVIILRKP